MLAFSPFLSQWTLLTPFGLITVVSGQGQDAILRGRQDRYGLMSPLVYAPTNVSVGRFKQAAKSPLGDIEWRPARQLSGGFTTWKKRLHDHKPDQKQTVLIFPDTRHSTKQMRNERGQIRDFDHRSSLATLRNRFKGIY